MKKNELLANGIYIFHILVILFVLIAPFTNGLYFLLVHFTFAVCLLVHWWGNSDVCSLSVIESNLRGINYKDAFTHQFIAPLYEVSQTRWSQICYAIVILTLCISGYKLYNSDKWGIIYQQYNLKCKKTDSIQHKLKCIVDCLKMTMEL